MALQKHFRHSRRRPEIAVYLKRGMNVPQIRMRSRFQEVLQKYIRVVALARPRSRTQSVRERPARRFVSAIIERYFSRV